MNRFVATLVATGLAGLLGMALYGQVTDPITGQQVPPSNPNRPTKTPPPSPLSTPSLSSAGADESARDRTIRMAVEQEKLRNVDRQKKLISDTEKLVSLAAELKSDVDKSTKDTMSMDVIRKAEEIEKLAHSVKEKMKGS